MRALIHTMGSQQSTDQQPDRQRPSSACSIRRRDTADFSPPFQRKNSLPTLPNETSTDLLKQPAARTSVEKPARTQSFLKVKKSGLDEDIAHLYEELHLSDRQGPVTPPVNTQAWTQHTHIDSPTNLMRFERQPSSIDVSSDEDEVQMLDVDEELFRSRAVPGRESRLAYTRLAPFTSHYVTLPDNTHTMVVDFLNEDLFPTGAEDRIHTENSRVEDVEWVERQYHNQSANLILHGSAMITNPRDSSMFQVKALNAIFEANQPPSEVSELELAENLCDHSDADTRYNQRSSQSPESYNGAANTVHSEASFITTVEKFPTTNIMKTCRPAFKEPSTQLQEATVGEGLQSRTTRQSRTTPQSRTTLQSHGYSVVAPPRPSYFKVKPDRRVFSPITEVPRVHSSPESGYSSNSSRTQSPDATSLVTIHTQSPDDASLVTIHLLVYCSLTQVQAIS